VARSRSCAALSIVLNTAEGAGRSGAANKARFFNMARGRAITRSGTCRFGNALALAIAFSFVRMSDYPELDDPDIRTKY
jgi:hypothetical protein